MWDCSVDVFNLRGISKWKERIWRHYSKAHSLSTPWTLVSFAKAKFGATNIQREMLVGEWRRRWVGQFKKFRGVNGCESLVLKVLHSLHLSFLICQGVTGETYLSELVYRLRETVCEKYAAQSSALKAQKVFTCWEHKSGSSGHPGLWSCLSFYFLSKLRTVIHLLTIHFLALTLDHRLK